MTLLNGEQISRETLTVAGLISRLMDLPPDAPVCAVGELDNGEVCIVWPGSVDFDGKQVVLRDGYGDVSGVRP